MNKFFFTVQSNAPAKHRHYFIKGPKMPHTCPSCMYGPAHFALKPGILFNAAKIISSADLASQCRGQTCLNDEQLQIGP